MPRPNVHSSPFWPWSDASPVREKRSACTVRCRGLALTSAQNHKLAVGRRVKAALPTLHPRTLFATSDTFAYWSDRYSGSQHYQKPNLTAEVTPRPAEGCSVATHTDQTASTALLSSVRWDGRLKYTNLKAVRRSDLDSSSRILSG